MTVKGERTAFPQLLLTGSIEVPRRSASSRLWLLAKQVTRREREKEKQWLGQRVSSGSSELTAPHAASDLLLEVREERSCGRNQRRRRRKDLLRRTGDSRLHPVFSLSLSTSGRSSDNVRAEKHLFFPPSSSCFVIQLHFLYI